MKRIVLLSWLQVAAATALILLVFTSVVRRPTLQFDYSRQTGQVTGIVPGGTSDRAGLRNDDKVLSIRGEKIGRGVNPLYFVQSGEQVPVVTGRGTINIEAVPFERSRREALRAGGARIPWAIESYLVIPLNIWMLALGIVLLRMRPNNQDARLSAISLVAWAGGNFLGDIAGMGATLSVLPTPLRVAVYAIDAYFLAVFFAAALRFAIIFPSESGRRVRPVWHILPYIAALPIFLEVFTAGLRRLNSSSAITADIYLTLGPILLLVALAVLAVRFFLIRDRNAKRRVGLIFISLLPGVFGFVFSVIISRLELGPAWSRWGSIVNKVGVVAGSGIYAYAVVRHRMYNIRVLVRRSIQYAFARGTLFALMSLPVIGLAAFLWAHRNTSLGTLLTGTPAVYILVILPLLLVARYRRRLLEALDRRFFREQYDARQLLLHVVSMVRDGSDLFGLSRVALDEIEKALHPKHISLWQRDDAAEEFRRELSRGDASTAPPPLPTNAALATLLATDDEPLDVYTRHSRALVRRLPQAERDWLRAADAYLLVPLVIEGKLGGLLLLGERMSEEPYSREDRDLLRTLAAQLAMTFDYSRLKASPSLVWASQAQRTPPPLLDELRTCTVCGRCFSSEHQFCDVDEQPLVREDGVPRTIEEKYVVTRILGRGGMGSVYMATQKRLNRPVAIKVLLGHLVGSSSMRGRFEREARIVARLRHPAIVTIHDFGVLPSSHHAYLVMEYLEGQTLRKTINGGALAVDAMLDILRPVADAVDTAHRSGIVHRDLKPENIMIVPDRDRGTLTPRVLDFGLAKMSGPIGDDEATLVQSGQSIGIVGTLMYIAPEILRGGEADARSDQYSLALIAYELLTGLHPFAMCTDLAAVVKSQTEVDPEPLTNVPPFVAEAIQRALCKDAAQRWPSVAEFVSAMQ
ncbi:MAG TPA: protein kinase [Thermoanaerobaculia bacterium]|nr:protein kinase [Thermoanaerobaculia bacterium]